MPKVAHLYHSGTYWKVEPAVHTSSIFRTDCRHFHSSSMVLQEVKPCLLALTAWRCNADYAANFCLDTASRSAVRSRCMNELIVSALHEAMQASSALVGQITTHY